MHTENKNLINVIHWGMTPDADSLDIDVRENLAPDCIVKKSYIINFGKAQKDEIEQYKVVEARLHNDCRVTIIYSGFASYTFQLKNARN